MASPSIQRSSFPLRKLPTFRDKSAAATSVLSTTGSASELISTVASPRALPASSPSASQSVLEAFAEDKIFFVFLSSSFDCVKFSSQALASGSAAATAEKLQEGIRFLEKQLRSEVLSKHDQLLAHLSFVSHADTSLSALRSSVSLLRSAVRQVRSELSEPHREIQRKTVEVSNLRATCDLLQSSIRVLRLSKKLRDLMASSSDPDRVDLAKAAQLSSEILNLGKENELAGIDAVNEELRFVSEAEEKIRSSSMEVLERGLQGLNQADVATGLQAFYNLGDLKKTIEDLMRKYRNSVSGIVASALDMKAISATPSFPSSSPGGIQRTGTPQMGSGIKAKEALWQRMKNSMEEIHAIVIAVWHLQRVLTKKKDPFTLVLLVDSVIQEGDSLLTERLWEETVKSFEFHMKSSFNASSFVRETLTVGYPKLLAMVENFMERTSRDTDVKGVAPAVNEEQMKKLLASIEIFQTAFLTSCLSRLSDLVNSVFPGSTRGGVPSKEQVWKIIIRIQEEIEAAQPNVRLTLLVSREAISKALLLLAERAEYQVWTGPEARQVAGPATPAQIKNFALHVHLQEIHSRLVAANVPPAAAEILSPSVGAIYGIAYDAVSALFQSMLDRVESIVLQIHDRDFGVSAAAAAMDGQASPYMEDLKKQLVHFRGEFLSRLQPPPPPPPPPQQQQTIRTKLVRSMASRILAFFIRHAALVRPLSESGKLRMAKDMAELELTVGQNLHPVESLGAPYRALRAFRPVIFLETSQIGGADSHVLHDLPPSVVLHHLYSRGPDDLQSPMQRNKLTPLQYSLWMDSHTELDIWRGIRATLTDYRDGARGDDPPFLVLYHLMLTLGSVSEFAHS